MSNVLIGIIGVILFIGLALAGALILGDDFKSSKSSTMATKTLADMHQIAAAMNMRTLKTGAPMISSNYDTNVAALVPRFLKVAPTVPNGGGRYQTPDLNGYGTSQPADLIQARIGPVGDESAKAICAEIESQAGANSNTLVPVTTMQGWGARVAASGGSGCFPYFDGAYWAFMKV